MGLRSSGVARYQRPSAPHMDLAYNLNEGCCDVIISLKMSSLPSPSGSWASTCLGSYHYASTVPELSECVQQRQTVTAKEKLNNFPHSQFSIIDGAESN